MLDFMFSQSMARCFVRSQDVAYVDIEICYIARENANS